MVDSPTTRNRLRKQELGTNTNAWGDPKLNEVLDSIDQSMDGYLAIALTGDITLTTTNYTTADQAKRRVLKFTGTLSASANVIVPSVEHEYNIINAAGNDVVVKTFAGTGVTIPTGYQARVYCDANNVNNGSPTVLPGSTSINGALSVSGKISGVTAGTATTDAVNKDQMETAIATAGLPSTAGTALVSSNDTTAGYLGQKLIEGTGIDLTDSGAGNSTLTIAVDTTELEEFLALSGKVTATLSAGTTAMTARRRYRISSTATGTLPAMVAGDFVIVEFTNGGGVTATVGRNSQTIDGAASDDTYIGTGKQGPVLRYSYASAGAVTSRLIEGIPV